jgi:hypothetical protein
MTPRPRVWIILGVAAALVLVIGANWRFVDLAMRSQLGCVAEHPGQPAAKPGC